VLKLERSNVLKEPQLENKYFIDRQFEVIKEDVFKDVKE
jgi:hypothetical protein